MANVGDSTIVLAKSNPRAEEPGQHAVIARVLTKDHKPDDPEETKQVERLGKEDVVCVCVRVYVCTKVLFFWVYVCVSERERE